MSLVWRGGPLSDLSRASGRSSAGESSRPRRGRQLASREQWLHHAKCDAREGAGNCACLQQVFARCEHCDRNLCEMHYANDQMRFKVGYNRNFVS
uniref:AN1-type domain-containing protein n=1 Tax=Macrostomum lignano TaxID=282301 RepID=A0A1I8JR83_9PLAT